MANEEQINRENGSTKDVIVPADKDASICVSKEVIKSIPKEVLIKEVAKINAEEQKNYDCEKAAAKYFMEHPSTSVWVNGRLVTKLNTYDEALKLIKATPEPIVKELARLYEVNKQLKDQSLRSDGYARAAMDLSPNNHGY